MQSQNIERHVSAIKELVQQGKAYRCYCTAEELEAEKQEAKSRGLPVMYSKKWRDQKPQDESLPHTVRLKVPENLILTLHDGVQGKVEVHTSQIDDFILLRADGTPTYMPAVVIDDLDMGITHVIRGTDHLTNTFKQMCIFQAMAAPIPEYMHIPLIHNSVGAKLSKRDGALGVEEYLDAGILPEALLNCLLRLGWGHGDDEIIGMSEAKSKFSAAGIGKSPARFDIKKLEALNAHYLREKNDTELMGSY